jgi:hypothetical protein
MPSDRVLLYLHIPKCGGTTLSAIIYNQVSAEEKYEAEQDPSNPLPGHLFYSGVYYFPGKDAYYGFFKDRELSIPVAAKRAFGRKDLRAVVGHFWFGVHRYLAHPWTYITLLRHPLDRVLSLYSHLKRHNGLSLTLEEFVASPSCREVDNDQTRRISGLEPELGACTKAMLETAKDNLRRHFSVVGVTERFDETLIVLKWVLGWTKDLLYYPQNTSPDRLAIDSLAPAIRDALLGWNELDLELYEFANRLLDQRIAAQGAAFRDELEELQDRKHALMQQVEKQLRREGARQPS